MASIVLYIGGNGPEHKPEFPTDVVTIIAADSGLDLALSHGVTPNKLIGDMDSVSSASLKSVEARDCEVFKTSSEKDETDLELAISTAKEFEADSLLVIGGGGQRPDHFLSNIAVLCGKQTLQWNVEVFLDNAHMHVCRPNQSQKITGNIGDTISLIPIAADVIGVTTTGLKWELKDSALKWDHARGMSNEFEKTVISVSLTHGTLILVQPSTTVF